MKDGSPHGNRFTCGRSIKRFPAREREREGEKTREGERGQHLRVEMYDVLYMPYRPYPVNTASAHIMAVLHAIVLVFSPWPCIVVPL